MLKVLKSNRGNVIIGASGMLLLTVMILALALNVFPAFIAKQQLDTYAEELCRTAEITGRIGEETNEKAKRLSEQTGLNPKITWSKKGKIQLDDEFTVTCTIEKDIGGSFVFAPVNLNAVHTGRSEMYWK
jgi:hypothetical protein